MNFFKNQDDFISTKCPHCSGDLQFDENMEKAICPYCGSKFLVNKNKFGKTSLDKILDFSERQLDFVKNYITKRQEQKQIKEIKRRQSGKKALIVLGIIGGILFAIITTLIVLEKVGII